MASSNSTSKAEPAFSQAHQVLARKLRPRNFSEMVGQEHVLRALTNALNTDRLHHAYLFTGTRGTGKTTLGRILTKCFNCNEGVSATPCGNCDNCLAIDQGRYIDLIEVDAASRTKVEDTRELLENVQYLPSQGKYKVYLIDEVHMLSGHSFNALLKTLEEPPAHVKFLLATTDPQRLPITILSRCLQFHLKKIAPELISDYLAHVLQQESITYETAALQQLSKAADGSMRDALSLLDQAIAYGGDKILQADICAMLGLVEQDYLWQIVAGLVERNATTLVECCRQLAAEAADFSQALEELLSVFHQIAVAQALPETITNPLLEKFAALIGGEEVQLYYQIGLIGRRDLPLAPSPQIGFEMVLLRMLAYRPVPASEFQATKNFSNPESSHESSAAKAVTKTIAVQTEANFPEPPAINAIVETTANNPQPADWLTLIAKLKLSGLNYTLAAHCILKEFSAEKVHLQLDAAFSAMLNQKLQKGLNDAFDSYCGKPVKLLIDVGAAGLETPAVIQKRQQALQQHAAAASIQNDPVVQQLIQQFDAKIELSTLKLKNNS